MVSLERVVDALPMCLLSSTSSERVSVVVDLGTETAGQLSVLCH